MVNQIVNQISEFVYESVKSEKLNKRNTWYFCFYYRVCFFPILYKTTRKFPILGVGSCSQNAEKKPCICSRAFWPLVRTSCLIRLYSICLWKYDIYLILHQWTWQVISLLYVPTQKFINIIINSGWSLAWIFMKERVDTNVTSHPDLNCLLMSDDYSHKFTGYKVCMG